MKPESGVKQQILARQNQDKRFQAVVVNLVQLPDNDAQKGSDGCSYTMTGPCPQQPFSTCGAALINRLYRFKLSTCSILLMCMGTKLEK